MAEADDDRALQEVLAYDASFVPRYAHRFGERLLSTLDLGSRPNVLDLACRTGYPTTAILEQTRDGRVIGLDADPRCLEVARGRVGSELGRRVFFKQGAPTELKFSGEVFTHVVGNLIDRIAADRGAVLSESRRVLRPGGQIVLTLPLRGSFIEVTDLLREVALRLDAPRVTERVDQYVATLPTPDSFRAELESKGFSQVFVQAWEFSLDYASGSDLLSDPLVHAAALGEWRWCAEAAPDPDRVLHELRASIDTYFSGRRFPLSVVGGCASGVRDES